MSRRKFLKSAMGLAIIASMPLASTNVFAWNGVASEWTQIANGLLLIKNLANQMIQIRNQVNQYVTMAKNTLNIPNDIWHMFAQEMAKFASVYKESRNLVGSFAHIDDKLKSVYQNYDFYKLKKMSMTDYFMQYSSWHKVNKELVDKVFSLVGLTSEKIENHEDEIAKIIALNRRSNGHQQTIQITNELLAKQSQQLNTLTQLATSQLQMNAQITAKMEAEDAMKKANEERASRRSITIIGDERVF
jgi:type IV secretion system protein TrbJ